MFKQVELSYSFDALEPYIDTLTMETHYGKHHAAYTANLNKALEKIGNTEEDIVKVLANLDKIEDAADRTAVRNNGGGYYNHNLYFSIMSPHAKKLPEGELAIKIDKTFGSTEALIEKLSALAAGQFGSGWAWLSVTPDGELAASNSANQDNPISLGTGNMPILAIDVWEHAYYLQYKNVRAAYIKAFFEVLDWSKVEELYQAAVK